MGREGQSSPSAVPGVGLPRPAQPSLPTRLYAPARAPHLQKLARWRCRWVRREQAQAGAPQIPQACRLRGHGVEDVYHPAMKGTPLRGPGSWGRARAGGETDWGPLDKWGTLCPPFACSSKPSVQGAWPLAGACWSRDTLILERTSKGHRPPQGLPLSLGWGDSPVICCPTTPPRRPAGLRSTSCPRRGTLPSTSSPGSPAPPWWATPSRGAAGARRRCPASSRWCWGSPSR